MVPYTPDATELRFFLCGTSTHPLYAPVSHWVWQCVRRRFVWPQKLGWESHAWLQVKVPLDKTVISALLLLEPPPLPSEDEPLLSPPMTAVRQSARSHCSPGSTDTSHVAPPLLAGCPSLCQHPGIDLAVTLDGLCQASWQPTHAWEVQLSEVAHGLIAQLSVLHNKAWGYSLWVSYTGKITHKHCFQCKVWILNEWGYWKSIQKFIFIQKKKKNCGKNVIQKPVRQICN